MSGQGLEGERSYPSEGGEELGLPTPVGLAAAVLDTIASWLAPSRETKVVRVPEFRGQHVSDTFLAALQAGVKTHVVRLTEHPAPVDGYVVAQDPLPGVRVKRDSRVSLIVRHPEDPRWKQRA